MGSGYSSLQCETSNFDEVGVIPRVLHDLFQTIEDQKQNDSKSAFTVRVSFVEVYNEKTKVM